MILLVTGHLRSGTTLLMELCNSHPDICLTQEFGNFEWLDVSWSSHAGYLASRLRVKGRRPLRPGLAPGPRSTLSNLAFTLSYLSYLKASSNFRLKPVTTQMVEQALYKLFPDISIVGDKYPNYMFSLDKYLLRDKVSVLVIYRDCRDVTASTLKMVRGDWKRRRFIKKIDSAEKIAQRWTEAIESMQRHADRIHAIQYEALIDEPKAVMASLGEWLNVDPSRFECGSVHAGSIGKHKTDLTDAQLNTVLRIAGPTLSHLGYL